MTQYGGLITEIIHPFGRGALTSTGTQYSTAVSTSGSTSYIDVEEVTVPLPTNARVLEIEFGLTQAYIINVTTDSPLVQYQIKENAQTSYDTLVSFGTTVLLTGSTTNIADFTCAGRHTPSDGTYYTGKGTFQIKGQIATSASTSKAAGSMKNSSYLAYSYILQA